jgi:hypothetical protein
MWWVAIAFFWTMTSSAQTPASVAPASAQAGFVKTTRGDVQLQSANGALRAARGGEQVAPTDRVVTGPDSGASIILRDGTTLVVGPASQLDLKEFSYESTT